MERSTGNWITPASAELEANDGDDIHADYVDVDDDGDGDDSSRSVEGLQKTLLDLK